MIVTIDTQNIEDANQFGEALRNYCFIPDTYGGTYGCYSTFELRPEFEKVKKSSRLGIELLSLFSNNYCEDYISEVKKRSQFYSNGIIHLMWFWDGDGTLLIIEGNKKAINYDCKTDYEWEWL